MGHARSLVSIEDEATQLKIYNDIITHQLSVRQTEELVRGNTPQTSSSKHTKGKTKRRNILSLEELKMLEEIGTRLETLVEMKRLGEGAGKILISFKSDSDLQRILKKLEL
jgi:ParB family chromosome partitioning protein